MTKQVTKKKLVRKQYTPEYRAEALSLADRVGVTEAARQLGIDGGLIYNWRKALEAKASVSQAEQSLAAENARLKRQLAEQTEELAILKKGSSRNAGKSGFDLQEEVAVIPVAVGHAFDDLDTIVDALQQAGIQVMGGTGDNAVYVRL